ncbi:MAG: EAL domain-containing protein [Alphaproteobacteria bacterium]
MSKKILNGIIIVDNEGIITSADFRVEDIFGYNQGELAGKQARIILPDTHNINEPLGLIYKIAENDKLNFQNYSGIKYDDTEVPLEIAVTKITIDNENAYVCYIKDISNTRIYEKIDDTINGLLSYVFGGGGISQFSNYICDSLTETFKFSLVSLVLKKGNGQVILEAKAGRFADKYSLPEIKWDDLNDKGLIARAIRSQKTMEENISSAPKSLNHVLVIPFIAYDDVIFVLEIHSNTEKFTKEIRDILENFASRVGVALQIMHDQNQLRLQGAAIASTTSAIFITDNNGIITWVNNAFTKLSGYRPEEVIGLTPAVLKSGEQKENDYKDLWSTIRAGKVWFGEFIEKHKNNSLYTVEQTVTPIKVGDDGNVHYVAVHNDLTAHKNAEGRIHQLANYDQLTGLYNRNAFIEILNKAVKNAKGKDRKIAVIFVDLTNFNRINDTLGHFAGDRLLKIMAGRISLILPEKSALARMAGDEFAIALTDVEKTEDVANFARNIIENILEPVDLGKDIINIGACVGISIYPDDGASANKLINYADMALHKAVRSAPNSYFFFSKEMNIETEARLILEQDLRKAIYNDEFVLHYQPIISISKNRVVGFEALIRWKHPQKGMIAPINFIPIAEDTGLIIPIGDWIIKEAIGQQKFWIETGLGTNFISINLSAIQFQQENLVDDIERNIIASNVNPANFEFELTETVFMQDLKKTDEKLSKLTKLGVRISIDDFGTGYSSLSYLKKLSVDKLKIDRSFVSDMTSDYDDAKIACAIINLGKSLGLEVVSEGVENFEQFEMLKHHGCDLIQGYLFAKPMPAKEIPDFVKSFKIE